MQRRSEIGLWIALVVVAVLAGVGIAGLPDLGADEGGGAQRVAATADTTALDDTEASTTTASDAATSTSTSTSTSTTTSTTPEPRPNDQVAVLVANGTSVPGAASSLGDRLGSEGHPIEGAVTVRSFDRTELWFAEGWEVEARALAERLALPADAVVPVPGEPAVDPGVAAIVVVIGPELAAVL